MTHTTTNSAPAAAQDEVKQMANRAPRRRRAVLTLTRTAKKRLPSGIVANVYLGTLECEGFLVSDLDCEHLGTIAYALNVGPIEFRAPSFKKNESITTYAHHLCTPLQQSFWSEAGASAQNRLWDERRFLLGFKDRLRYYRMSISHYSPARDDDVEAAIRAIPDALRDACFYPTTSHDGTPRRPTRKLPIAAKHARTTSST